MGFGKTEYVPVVAENGVDDRRMLLMSATSPPDEGGGFAEFFSRAQLLSSDENRRFEEALAIGDSRLDGVFAMAMLDDGTTWTGTVSFPTTNSELRYEITGEGIDVYPEV